MVDYQMVGISLFMISQHLMVNNHVVGIRHSPCTPDFIPADSFLFLEMKPSLKWKKFQDIDNIMSVTAELSAVCLNAFNDFFMQLFEICKKCVAVKGDYFEEK